MPSETVGTSHTIAQVRGTVTVWGESVAIIDKTQPVHYFEDVEPQQCWLHSPLARSSRRSITMTDVMTLVHTPPFKGRKNKRLLWPGVAPVSMIEVPRVA